MGMRNTLRLLQEALVANEQFDLASGEALSFLPKVDDQGAIEIGDGTTDMDLKIFLGSTTEFVEFNVGDSQLNLNTAVASNSAVTLAGAVSLTGALTPSAGGGTLFKVSDLTSNTTLNSTHLPGIITNRGAVGALIHTLPDTATTGWWFLYFGVANVDVTFATETADTLIAGLDDAAADSLAFSTAGEKIGAVAVGIYDGTQWHAHALQGTGTVATA